MPQALTISELEQAAGVPRSTVRFYTRRGLLPQPGKTAAGGRLYSEHHIQLLKRIGDLRNAGLSLMDIKAELESVLAAAEQDDAGLVAQEYERVHRTILRVATDEFIMNGYDRAHVPVIVKKAGVTPYAFYAHFSNKPRLLLECFNAFVKSNVAFLEPYYASVSDPGENFLFRITGSLRSQAIGADVLSVVRSEGLGPESGLRELAEEAWGDVMRPVIADLHAMRPPASPVTSIPIALLADCLAGAFDNIYLRSTWDHTYAVEDLLLTILWLYLAVRAAMSGEVDVESRLAGYAESVQEAATREVEDPPWNGPEGNDPVYQVVIRTAVEQLATKGYQHTHVATIIQEAGISPQRFYAYFSSKRQMLAECFNALVRRNTASVEPEAARVADAGERFLLRLVNHLRTQALGVDVLVLVRSGAMQENTDIRRPIEEAWKSATRGVAEDLAGMRPAASPASAAPDELIAYALLGAIDGTYLRSTWSNQYTVVDLLQTLLWLYLAVRAAMSGEVDVESRLATYGERIQQIARSGVLITPGLPY